MSRLFPAAFALGAPMLFGALLFGALLFGGEAQAQFPVQSTYPTYGTPNYGYGYAYGYSAPYRSQAYPQGTSYLGPPVYTGYISRYPRRNYGGYNYYRYPQVRVPQVRVQRTPAQSSTFGGAHSSHYFGDPHASQSFSN